jgi:hypothetical protein
MMKSANATGIIMAACNKLFSSTGNICFPPPAADRRNGAIRRQ